MLTIALGLAFPGAYSEAQQQPAQPAQEAPPGFQNLQVLPMDIDRRELMNYMKGFAMGLGVRCWYCHKGEGDDLSKFDFAADEKRTKAAARVMLRMVKAINEDHLSKVPREKDAAPVTVMCATCHRGQPRPEVAPLAPPPRAPQTAPSQP